MSSLGLETYKALKVMLFIVTLFSQNLLLATVIMEKNIGVNLSALMGCCSLLFSMIMIYMGMHSFLSKDTHDGTMAWGWDMSEFTLPQNVVIIFSNSSVALVSIWSFCGRSYGRVVGMWININICIPSVSLWWQLWNNYYYLSLTLISFLYISVLFS